MASTDGSYESSSLGSTLVIASMWMVILYTLFELNRHTRRMYLQRRSKKLIESGLVPPIPPRHVFGWLVSIFNISDEHDLLPMCGLDSYIMLEYTKVCFKIAVFFSVVGIVIFLPVYATAGNDGNSRWNQYTISNVPDNPSAYQLWAPSVIIYLYAFYFCHLLDELYADFVLKRLEYLKNGDPNTPKQTYYSIMVEGIPPNLRSAAKLQTFFEELLPGQVHSVKVTLDLSELEKAVQQRRLVRDRLERVVAQWKATGHRPTCWVASSQQLNEADYPGHLPLKHGYSFLGALRSLFPVGQQVAKPSLQFDAIDQLCLELTELNTLVSVLQDKYFSQTEVDESDAAAARRDSEACARSIGHMELAAQRISRIFPRKSRLLVSDDNAADGTSDAAASLLANDLLSPMILKSADNDRPTLPLAPSQPTQQERQEQAQLAKSQSQSELPTNQRRHHVLSHAGRSIKQAAQGVLRSAANIERHLELLTVGAAAHEYNTASTGFVTFNSRVAQSMAHQMLLSHEYSMMRAKPSPNPNDIIWKNVAVPEKQLSIRKDIAGVGLAFLAMFWSVLVAFITSISNLQSMQSSFPGLDQYTSSYWYKFVNSYLTSVLLLTCIALLPLIFDFVARSYEGLKLESEIQNSIMKRYFYYQLANVFVSVGLGSISGSIQQVIDTPRSIFVILGQNLPGFSMYFTNLLIVKAFTVVPIQLLRTWPLILHSSVGLCLNERKCSWRDLRTGVFAPPTLVYGWIYPSLLMVLMIITTYSCLAPLLMPFGVLYFGLFYCMLKYQILFVYINSYQSGGYMWYAVFRRSMVALLMSTLTLICYMAIRRSFLSGPFYLLLPLPFGIIRFWNVCEAKHKAHSQVLSLEGANQLDKEAERKSMAQGGAFASPCDDFQSDLFMSSALLEEELKPAPYRRKEPVADRADGEGGNSGRGSNGGGGGGGGGGSANVDSILEQSGGLRTRLMTLSRENAVGAGFDSTFHADDPEGAVELWLLLSERYKRAAAAAVAKEEPSSPA